MKKIFKAAAILFSFVFVLSSCTGGGMISQEETTVPANPVNEVAPTSDGKIVIPYNEADGLNPFFAQSYENLYVCKLLYGSLFRIDENYNVIPQIAENITVSGNTATVKVDTSTGLNAEDAVYSFNLAKTSYNWSNMLGNVLSATAVSVNTVQFELGYSDVFVSGILDFPVVKLNTANERTSVPTGFGDYRLENGMLVKKDGSSKIYLHGIETNESAKNAFKIGETDVYFSDLSDCEFSEISGKTETVALNSMVFLGVNSSRGALQKYVRCAISAKLDCDEIALSDYQGHAVPAKLPVHPNSSLKNETSTVSTSGNSTTAERILDNCGYIKYSGNTRTNGAYPLSMTLIVNNDNNYRIAAAYSIAESLKECGFSVTVMTLGFEDYRQRIISGNYDLYLGEIKLDNTFNLSPFFTAEAELSAGIDLESKSVTEYFRYRAGEITASEYYDVFTEEYPFIPICFRNGYAVVSSDIK